MHPTALNNAKLFFETYAKNILSSNSDPHLVEIGSQDVNGSIREVCSIFFKYTGLDFVAAKGVDIILDDPYTLPFENSSVDVVISSSCFEHSEMFWLVYLEVLRVLKPHGLFYLNAPSGGQVHRYPVDCWRFYPDSGRALVTWAKRNGYTSELLESFVSNNEISASIFEQWNDFVAIFIKDNSLLERFPNKIVDSFEGFTNGLKYGSSDFIRGRELTEAQIKIVTK